MLCPSKTKRIWLDDPTTRYEMIPADLYDPKLQAPYPPPYRTLADKSAWSNEYEEWTQIIATIIEDRFRRFRAAYSTGGDSTDDPEEED